MLFERTPQGNLLRVNADNLDRPFDINGGVKLDLGSTAKLRTAAHYLGVVALLRDELAGRDAAALTALARAASTDPLTAWAAETLAKTPDLSLEALLEKALDRRYATSTGETFFTGGGQHVFGNFSRGPAILPVRDALRVSNNLVFIRVMRDLVRYHQARLPYDVDALLNDPAYPERERIVAQLADDEARQILSRAYGRYHGLTPDAAIARMLGTRAKSTRHLAILFYAWKIGSTPAQLGDWLRSMGAPVDDATVRRLVRSYGGRHLTLLDYGYLVGRHPLEVWTVGELVHEPGTNWEALLARSAAARGEVSRWLTRPRASRAQRTRLRTYVERDAFARMTPYWQRLGFPFDRLVPSLATAIGTSSDRPAALAELMGIIVNDGMRLPMLRLTQLQFGAGTPYETVMVPRRDAGERVMQPEVARALRRALATVVESGTAGRLAGAFKDADGKRIVTGGKTGSGDNRFKTYSRGGGLKSSRAVSRTATFAFYVGERYFGVITAFVPGQKSDRYEFTSALSVSVLRLLAPTINDRIAGRPLT
jgi:cell division protein FtsI/penicillin-binding protein 2